MTSSGDDPDPRDPITPREAWDAATGKRPGRIRQPSNRLGCGALCIGLLTLASILVALLLKEKAHAAGKATPPPARQLSARLTTTPVKRVWG